GVVHRPPGDRPPVQHCARGRQRGARPRGGAGAPADARPLREAPADGGRLGLKLALMAAASVLSFVQGRAQPDGGYAEPGGRSTVALTATAVLSLRAAGAPVPAAARGYLLAHEEGLTPTELELVVMAEAVSGGASESAL